MRRGIAGFAIAASATALVVGVLSRAAATGFGTDPGWAVLGATLVAFAGIVGGTRLAGTHGRPGSGFVAALVISVLFRFASLGAGLWLALRAGGSAPSGFLIGFGIAFLAFAALEAIWFTRASRSAPVSESARGA